MAEGSDSAKSKGKTGLLARRLQQKERIYGQRESEFTPASGQLLAPWPRS